MAAREPELSTYARTKRAAEQLLMAVLSRRCDLNIVRPCAIYGPWDRETLTIFRAVAYPHFSSARIAHGRVAVIHAEDAAKAIATLCDQGPPHSVFELTDERTQGYSWDEIVGTAQSAMDSRAFVILYRGRPSEPLLRSVWLRPGSFAAHPCSLQKKLPRFCMPIGAPGPSASRRAICGALQSTLPRVFRDTVSWYRDRRWLAAR